MQIDLRDQFHRYRRCNRNAKRFSESDCLGDIARQRRKLLWNEWDFIPDSPFPKVKWAIILAREFRSLGENESCLDWLNRADAILGSDSSPFLAESISLKKSLLREQLYQRNSVSFFKKALDVGDLKRETATLAFILAETYRRIGMEDKARQLFQQLLKLKRLSPRLLNRIDYSIAVVGGKPSDSLRTIRNLRRAHVQQAIQGVCIREAHIDAIKKVLLRMRWVVGCK
jgi:tetratricopeptide (TPR) repeat protein